LYLVLIKITTFHDFLHSRKNYRRKNFKASIGEGQFIEDYPYLIVVVDALDKVKEIDETNNYYAVKML
jgi:hypothetical protein